MTRANPRGLLGFMKDVRRLNVAVTRARSSLWVIGSESTFKSHHHWSQLIAYLGCKNSAQIETLKQYYDATKYIAHTVHATYSSLDTPISIDQSAPWKLTLSKLAVDSLKTLRRAERESVIKGLGRLTQGNWGKPNPTTLADGIPLKTNKFPVGNFVAIWSIGLAATQDCYEQVAKIWNICHKSDIKRNEERIKRILAVFTEEYKQLCHLYFTGNRLFPQMHQIDQVGRVQFTKKREGTSQDDDDDEASDEAVIEMDLKKTYTVESIELMKLMDDTIKNVEFSFDMTEEQLDIMRFGGSALVLGRSGTGKVLLLYAVSFC